MPSSLVSRTFIGPESRCRPGCEPVPFDVDVGTSSTGKPVAVYPRSVDDEEVDLFRYSTCATCAVARIAP
jgi:hypothetical protein